VHMHNDQVDVFTPADGLSGDVIEVLFEDREGTSGLPRMGGSIGYRLEGKDLDWQDVGTRRQAFYNDLAPGRYRFHVTASNNSGVWNEGGAAL
jgi:hypothetical protein